MSRLKVTFKISAPPMRRHPWRGDYIIRGVRAGFVLPEKEAQGHGQKHTFLHSPQGPLAPEGNGSATRPDNGSFVDTLWQTKGNDS